MHSELEGENPPHPGVTVRACPLCGSAQRSVVFDLEAAAFCSVNWTYSKDFRRLLDLPDKANFPIDRCVSCGFVFSRYRPDASFLRRVYESVIQSDDCRMGSENLESYGSKLHCVAGLLGLAAAAGLQARTALDFGAGLGVTLRLLDACGIQAWGVDPSPSRCEYAARSGGRVVTSLGELGVTSRFDFLICDNVLEHVPDPVGTIQSLADHVPTGGLAFVSVPDYGEVRMQAQQAAVARSAPIDMTLNPWEHLNYFDLAHLDHALASGGFERLPASRIPSPVPIGLRPEKALGRRFKNSLASARRLVSYAWTGRGAETTEFTYYRKVR